jgi:hypothetical protein
VCVAALAILDRLDVIDVDTLAWWLCERQLPNGGLNGRPEKLEDVSDSSSSDLGRCLFRAVISAAFGWSGCGKSCVIESSAVLSLTLFYNVYPFLLSSGGGLWKCHARRPPHVNHHHTPSAPHLRGKIPEQKNLIDVIIGSSLISVLFPRAR